MKHLQSKAHCVPKTTKDVGELMSTAHQTKKEQARNMLLLQHSFSCQTRTSPACTEMKSRINGVESQMQSFKFLFGLILSELILRHTDKLSQTLQQHKLSTVEGHGVAMLTVKTIGGLRTDDNFDLLWEKVEKARDQLDVDEPQLGRRRKVPKRYEQGSAPYEFAVSVKEEYRWVYFEALHLAMTTIHSR